MELSLHWHARGFRDILNSTHWIPVTPVPDVTAQNYSQEVPVSSKVWETTIYHLSTISYRSQVLGKQKNRSVTSLQFSKRASYAFLQTHSKGLINSSKQLRIKVSQLYHSSVHNSGCL